MIYCSDDIALHVIPVNYYGIELEQKPQSVLFFKLGNSFFGLLPGPGLLPGYFLCFYPIRIDLMLSNYSIYLPAGDVLFILLLIKDLEFGLTIVDIPGSKLLYSNFLG